MTMDDTIRWLGIIAIALMLFCVGLWVGRDRGGW
jgi:hypothetical protein